MAEKVVWDFWCGISGVGFLAKVVWDFFSDHFWQAEPKFFLVMRLARRITLFGAVG